jgi:hypothetical protein
MSIKYPPPADITVIGPDDSTIWPTTAPTSTSAPQPPDEPPPTPPAPSKRLWVFQLATAYPAFIGYQWWFIYRPLDGSSCSACDEQNDFVCRDAGKDEGCNEAPDPDENGNPPFPDGSFTMARNEAKGCTYEGTAAGPGTLTCPGFSDPVQCRAASEFGNDDIPCGESGFNDAVYCDYS